MPVAYPSFPVLLESRDKFVKTAEYDRASNSQLRGRYFGVRKHECSLVHQLTLTQWDSLIATYDSVPNDDYVTFTWPGGTLRNYKITSFPDRVPLDGGDYKVTVQLKEI